MYRLCPNKKLESTINPDVFIEILTESVLSAYDFCKNRINNENNKIFTQLIPFKKNKFWGSLFFIDFGFMMFS
jgi:hypothetical protein